MGDSDVISVGNSSTATIEEFGRPQDGYRRHAAIIEDLVSVYVIFDTADVDGHWSLIDAIVICTCALSAVFRIEFQYAALFFYIPLGAI